MPRNCKNKTTVLTPRQEEVLSFVVNEYTQTAKAVSSARLASDARLRLSSASFRIVMSELEEMGYLTHPHTSAGKIPTEKGYQYFVDHLMDGTEPASAEERQFCQALHQASTLDMFRAATRLLADLTRLPSLVLPPLMSDLRCESISILCMGHDKMLLAVSTRSQVVHMGGITLSQDVTPEDVDALSEWGKDLCRGHLLSEMKVILMEAACRVEDDRLAGILKEIVTRGLDWIDSRSLLWYGAPWLAQQPEFSPRDLHDFLRALEEGVGLLELLQSVAEEEGVAIRIGLDLEPGPFSQCSVVASSYGIDGRALGAVGIVGPSRMRYARAATCVKALSRALSEALGCEGVVAESN